MYSLSKVMKTLPVGITYASFAGICIIATSVVGVVRLNQIPNNLYYYWPCFHYRRGFIGQFIGSKLMLNS